MAEIIIVQVTENKLVVKKEDNIVKITVPYVDNHYDVTFATDEETIAGVLTEKAVNPAGLAAFAADRITQTITEGVTDKAPSEGAVFDALALKAPLASPTFTGNPTAPTQTAGDNSTKIATTAYADAKVANSITDNVTGIAPSQNAVYDALALKAPLASPTFTGDVVVPDQTAGNNSTKAANTKYVDAGLALKANTTDVDDALALKADTADVADALALKADAADVMNAPESSVNENIPIFDGVTGDKLKDSGVKLSDKADVGEVASVDAVLDLAWEDIALTGLVRVDAWTITLTADLTTKLELGRAVKVNTQYGTVDSIAYTDRSTIIISFDNGVTLPDDITAFSRSIIKPSQVASFYWHRRQGAEIFGVKKVAQSTSNGWTLENCDITGRTITLTATDFTNHAAYNFEDVTVGTNSMISVPRCGWWRSPTFNTDGIMLISDLDGVEYDGKKFEANRVAYLDDTTLLDQYLIGKYRIRNITTPDSVAAGVAVGNQTYATFKANCAALGNGYSLLDIASYEEILTREVIEAKTYQLFAEAVRETRASCVYRGIQEWCYDGKTDTAADGNDGVYGEFLLGLEISPTNTYVLMNDNGQRDMVDTVISVPAGGYPQVLLLEVDSKLAKNLFIPKTTYNAVGSAIIPDKNPAYTGIANAICTVFYIATNTIYGAFGYYRNGTTSYKDAGVGGRLIKR